MEGSDTSVGEARKRGCSKERITLSGKDAGTQSERELDVFRRIHVRNQDTKHARGPKATKLGKLKETLQTQLTGPLRTRKTLTDSGKEDNTLRAGKIVDMEPPGRLGSSDSLGYMTTTLWYCGHCHCGPCRTVVCDHCFRMKDGYSYTKRLPRAKHRKFTTRLQLRIALSSTAPAVDRDREGLLITEVATALNSGFSRHVPQPHFYIIRSHSQHYL